MEQMGLLSRREKEVVTLLLQGKSNKNIALLLGVSEHTVEFHLKNIYAKWQVNSRVELILKLGKATDDITGKLRESVVDIADKNVHNGKQPATQNRWAQSLKHTLSIIKKELAMTRTIILEDAGNFLRKHPLLFTLLLLLAVSFVTHYLIINFGLFSWLSYILLGLLLSAGSIFFGFSWNKIVDGKFYFRPLTIAMAIMLPVLVAAVDLILRYTIAKVVGQVSTKIAGISNTATWLVSPDGNSYLYTERVVMNNGLWLFSVLCIVLLFFVGVLSSKRLKRKDLASA